MPTPFKKPNKTIVNTLTQPYNFWFNPSFKGLQNVSSSQPALYIGNHTFLAQDSLLTINALYQTKNIYLRAVGDRFLFKIPFWRNLLSYLGVVEGTRTNVANLMQEQQHILLYPGGGREVLKNKNETYQLFWKGRYGFIELALQHKYDIVPFAATGGDELFDIKFDSQDFKNSLFGVALQKLGLLKYIRNGELFLPWVTGYKGLPYIPKRTPMQIIFLPRINITPFLNMPEHTAKIQLRNLVAQQINQALMQHTNTTEVGKF